MCAGASRPTENVKQGEQVLWCAYWHFQFLVAFHQAVVSGLVPSSGYATEWTGICEGISDSFKLNSKTTKVMFYSKWDAYLHKEKPYPTVSGQMLLRKKLHKMKQH